MMSDPAGSKPHGPASLNDIIGQWGPYQGSLLLLALIQSTLTSSTLFLGSLWTPDLSHVCESRSQTDRQSSHFTWPEGGIHQCSLFAEASNSSTSATTTMGFPTNGSAEPSLLVQQLLGAQLECDNFLYNDDQIGQLLTNSFDLVCSRQWLRPLISDAALTGALLSSITLSQLSDRMGRMSCIRTGFVISILATVLACLSGSFFLLAICFLLMSYGQTGTTCALSTHLLESTGPGWRLVAVLQFGMAWAMAELIAPAASEIVADYRLFLLGSLVLQVGMGVLLYLGPGESVRWLLAAGRIDLAQIELQRASRVNGQRSGAQLALRIAAVQKDQVRRASNALALERAPAKLARASQIDLAEATRELNTMRAALEQQLESYNDQQQQYQANQAANGNGPNNETVSSPTCLSVPGTNDLVMTGPANNMPDCSISAHELTLLALRYARTIRLQDEGGLYLLRMFEWRTWRLSCALVLLSGALQTAYLEGTIGEYGKRELTHQQHYTLDALVVILATCICVILLSLMGRRAGLIASSLAASLCLFLAHLFEVGRQQNQLPSIDLALLEERILQEGSRALDQLEPRLYLVLAGQLCMVLALEACALVALESFPVSMRQSAASSVLVIGRLVSLAAGQLIGQDFGHYHVANRSLDLIACGAILLGCSLLPGPLLRHLKSRELADSLAEMCSRQQSEANLRLHQPSTQSQQQIPQLVTTIEQEKKISPA